METPNDTGRKRDPFEELNRKIDTALEEIRPKVRRALDELEQRVDSALDELKPKVQEARTRARPKVDDFVAEVQPRLDSVLARVQAALDRLRNDLDNRATRAEARKATADAAQTPWPEDVEPLKNNDPPKETIPEWPTRDSRDEPTLGDEQAGPPNPPHDPNAPGGGGAYGI